MTKEFFIKQLDDVIDDFEHIKSISIYDDFSDMEKEEIMKATSKAKSAVERITGDKSEYYKDIDIVITKTFHHPGEKLRHIMGTVYALRSNLQNDYLKSLSQIVESEVFSDYLEMADYLLKEGYKDASAVIIGSALETHLKKLCIANSISIDYKNPKGIMAPKKADVLNAELAKAKIYSGLNQKQITAWLAIRNSAAHGNYNDYNENESKLMLQGVRHFILSIK
ncbi:MAG: hypothetical protein O9302_08790 [Cyclobacteriaceae bacterium]|nr:hypothetical protein [Cytophagales bacterium]MCZ8328141.1 hypothetical protein [Cyclobacteriaceae bacterium]